MSIWLPVAHSSQIESLPNVNEEIDDNEVDSYLGGDNQVSDEQDCPESAADISIIDTIVRDMNCFVDLQEYQWANIGTVELSFDHSWEECDLGPHQLVETSESLSQRWVDSCDWSKPEVVILYAN